MDDATEIATLPRAHVATETISAHRPLSLGDLRVAVLRDDGHYVDRQVLGILSKDLKTASCMGHALARTPFGFGVARAALVDRTRLHTTARSRPLEVAEARVSRSSVLVEARMASQ